MCIIINSLIFLISIELQLPQLIQLNHSDYRNYSILLQTEIIHCINRQISSDHFVIQFEFKTWH